MPAKGVENTHENNEFLQLWTIAGRSGSVICFSQNRFESIAHWSQSLFEVTINVFNFTSDISLPAYSMISKNNICICKKLLLFYTRNGNHEHSNSNRLTHVPVVSKFFLLFDLMRWSMNMWWGLFSKIFQIIGWFGQMGRINCWTISTQLANLCVPTLFYLMISTKY